MKWIQNNWLKIFIITFVISIIVTIVLSLIFTDERYNNFFSVIAGAYSSITTIGIGVYALRTKDKYDKLLKVQKDQ